MRQNRSKLAASKAAAAINQVAENMTAAAIQNDVDPENAIDNPPEDLGPTAAGQTSHTGTNSLQVARNATTRMDVCIALYMPPSVQVSYGAKYNEQEIGVIAETGNAAIRAFMEGGLGGLMSEDTLKEGGGAIASGVGNWLKQKAPPGTAAMFAINSGSIITPRMELMFEGITRRNFSFNFTFIPKSKQEANVVHQIIKKFKYHMASNYGGLGIGGADGIREMEIPDFFNIRYMYQGGINPHLNLIKQCVLTNTVVAYGADKYKAYEGGAPQTTTLSLSFSELEIITKDYIAEGY